MELCLGTVQFGMDYGIRGGKKPSKTEIVEILDCAVSKNITMLDTAPGYGDAQSIIGKYSINHPGSFEIISKLSKDLFTDLVNPREYLEAVYQDAERTLQQLWIPYLKGMLFHNPKHLYDKNAVAALRELKKSGYTEWIGVSVYEPEDAHYAMELGLDLIQLPVNLFDHRFDEVIKRAGSSIRLFARSLFLQGLLLMDIPEAQRKLPEAAEYIIKYDQMCREVGCSRTAAALIYLKKKTGIHSIVLGVDNAEQLKQNVSSYQTDLPEDFIDKIATAFDKISDSIISPINWR